jgi:BASS family bile acid:Na+ symporter
MKTETIIRVLTIGALSGLLLGVGLRLTLRQVLDSLRQCRLALIIVVNFVVVPALAVTATRFFGIGADFSVGMILLAAAPFAPVVPVFARMARADLALAAGLTFLFPVLSAFLTPLVCAMALKTVVETGPVRFNASGILLTLVATITLPLCAGVAVNHFAPALGRRGLRPVEITSECAGALSLAFVTATEFGSILATGWVPLLLMTMLSEASLALGYLLGGPDRESRRVVALGTSNRNIALALLVAIQSFSGTPVVSAVVSNGLLLILLGLLHVAFWRFGPGRHRTT